MKEDNQLLKAEHDKYGIWYFTTIYTAAQGLKMVHNSLRQKFMAGNMQHKNWTFEWVDGSDIFYKFINPTKEQVYGI